MSRIRQAARSLGLGLGILGLFGQAATAQDSRLTSLETGQASRGWEGVGRIDIEGKGFCTGALIREDLVLTAAHCLYDSNGVRIPADRFQFLAGLRDGRAEAYRGVRQTVAHPDYLYTAAGTQADAVARDIAVLVLDQPIRTTGIKPFPIASDPRPGDQVGIVSYALDRAEAPSLQDVCEVVAEQAGVLVLTCDVDFGSSGAPVFMMHYGIESIVSVVAAMADYEGRKVSLATGLGTPLQAVMAQLEQGRGMRPVGNARVILPGDRNETGAKFVAPEN